MDWTTFLASVIGSLAWPAAAVALGMLLRKPLGNLLSLMKAVRYRGFEVEFGQRLEEAKDELTKAVPPTSATPELTPEHELLLRLVEISPRAAILEAWAQVEPAAVEATAKFGAVRSPLEAIRLLERSIEPHAAAAMSELRVLRNQVAHGSENLVLSPAVALEYVDSAKLLTRYLRTILAAPV